MAAWDYNGMWAWVLYGICRPLRCAHGQDSKSLQTHGGPNAYASNQCFKVTKYFCIATSPFEIRPDAFTSDRILTVLFGVIFVFCSSHPAVTLF